MFLKSLKRNERESLESLLDDLPRPGDFRIGSKASRAAARALLHAKKNRKENRVRWVVECVGRPEGSEEEASAKPLVATCRRSLYDDGQIFEFVDLCAGDVSEAEAERLIDRVPVDGKTYNLAEFRTKTGGASTSIVLNRVHNAGLE